jgi:ADP-ribose pyrophosphatase YjhB (NUDIX family)
LESCENQNNFEKIISDFHEQNNNKKTTRYGAGNYKKGKFMPKTEVGAGCAVIVLNERGQYLMLKRLSNHAYGTYCVPGGWIEFGEEFAEAGAREVMEETGCRVRDIEVVGVSNHIRRDERHHSVTVMMAAIIAEGEEPKNAEPLKCESIAWHDDWDNPPKPTMVAYNEWVPKARIMEYLKRQLRG